MTVDASEIKEAIGDWGNIFYDKDAIVIVLEHDIDDTPDSILEAIENLGFSWKDGEYVLPIDDD